MCAQHIKGLHSRHESHTWLAPVIQTTLPLNACFGSLEPSRVRSASALRVQAPRSSEHRTTASWLYEKEEGVPWGCRTGETSRSATGRTALLLWLQGAPSAVARTALRSRRCRARAVTAGKRWHDPAVGSWNALSVAWCKVVDCHSPKVQAWSSCVKETALQQSKTDLWACRG